jgi:hypothetical protein
MKPRYDWLDLILAVLAAIGVATVIVLLVGCGLVRMEGTYAIKSMVNEATFYRLRYMENCVSSHRAGADCAEWFLAQTKLDEAASEANDALHVGGSEKLQMAALRSQLDIVRKGFAKWTK